MVNDISFVTASSDITTASQASAWVDANKGRVIRRAEKFQPYSAYDIDDFIQEAYTAALTALRTCQEKPALKFEAAFWTIFTANLSSMSTMPSQRDMIGGSASLAPCIHEEYREEYSDNEEPPTPAYSAFLDPLTALIKGEAMADEILREEHRSAVVLRALMIMTEKQRQVWQCLLERRRPTTEQIAQRLNKTRQGVEQLRDYGLQRVKEAFCGKDATPAVSACRIDIERCSSVEGDSFSAATCDTSRITLEPSTHSGKLDPVVPVVSEPQIDA